MPDWEFVEPKKSNPAIDAAQSAVANGRARVAQQQEDSADFADTAKPDLTLTGYANGKPLVKGAGGEPFAASGSVTNGAITPGLVQTYAGDNNLIQVNDIPRVQVITPTTTKKTKSNIKVLYSVLQGGLRKFYVGGWKKVSVPLTFQQIDPTTLYISTRDSFQPSIDNLGGDDWAVSAASSNYLERINSNASKSWVSSGFYNSFFLYPIGYGFWAESISTSPLSSSTYSFNQITRTVEGALMIPLPGPGGKFDRYQQLSSYSVQDPFTGISTFDAYSTWRISPSGKNGVGFHQYGTYDGQTASRAGAPIFIGRPADFIWMADQSILEGRATVGIATALREKWVDVTDSGFSMFAKSDLTDLATQDKTITVTIYDKKYKKLKDVKTQCYKFDQTGTSLQIHGASYCEQST